MKINIVIPCYNEEKRLEFKKFLNFIEKREYLYFTFVNDGSTDKTLDLLRKLSKRSDRISLLDLKKNGGKAEAVRKGLKQSDLSFFDYIGFWDADLATPLEAIDDFVEVFRKRNDIHYISGARVSLLGKKIERKVYRHYIGRIFATFASMALQIPIYDSQCGAKVFASNQVEGIFDNKFISKWLFDIEIMKRLIKKYGIEKIKNTYYEYPLNAWKDIHGSKLKLIDFLKAPYELLMIYILG